VHLVRGEPEGVPDVQSVHQDQDEDLQLIMLRIHFWEIAPWDVFGKKKKKSSSVLIFTSFRASAKRHHSCTPFWMFCVLYWPRCRGPWFFLNNW
jgi:hypothetical protein